MQQWQEEIEEILEDTDAWDLFLKLKEHIEKLDATEEEKRLIGIILKHAWEVADPYSALWMAFWLGAAWTSIERRRT